MSYLNYYDKVVGTIRIATKSDCQIIGNNLRDQDALEMYNYDRSSPVEAVLNSFSKSTIAMTVEHDKIPIAMFGIMLINETPVLWMLTTDGLRKIGRNFVRNTREWINKMLMIYPVLIGYVDLRNQESMIWLKFVKAEFGKTVNMGIDNIPFRKFTFKRKEHKSLKELSCKH